MRCKKCNSEVKDTDNFCMHCGSKLRKLCNCWVNKKGNYNCGESSCPGYGLFRLEKIKDQENPAQIYAAKAELEVKLNQPEEKEPGAEAPDIKGITINLPD